MTQVPGITSPGMCPLIDPTVGVCLHSVWTASCCSELSWKQCPFATPCHILSTIYSTRSRFSSENQHHCLTHSLKLVTKTGLVSSCSARNCSSRLIRIKPLELVTCISLLQLHFPNAHFPNALASIPKCPLPLVGAPAASEGEEAQAAGLDSQIV